MVPKNQHLHTKKNSMDTKNNKLQIEGRVIWAGAIETGTSAAGKEFTKAQFIIEYQDGEYLYPAGFLCWGKTASAVDRLRIGDFVTVLFKPQTRTHENKLFTDLVAYYINIHWGKQAPVSGNFGPAIDQP